MIDVLLCTYIGKMKELHRILNCACWKYRRRLGWSFPLPRFLFVCHTLLLNNSLFLKNPLCVEKIVLWCKRDLPFLVSGVDVVTASLEKNLAKWIYEPALAGRG